MKVLVCFALLVATATAGRIDTRLMSRLRSGETLDVIIQLPSHDDIFNSQELRLARTREDRVATMISMMKSKTALARQPFTAILSAIGQGNQRSIQTPIWISNIMEVKDADLALATVLARVPGDFVIREPKVASIIDDTPGVEVEPKQDQYQWGVNITEAPRAWTVSRGDGVIVGIIDTGVYPDHEALRDSYAGAWYDPYYGTPEPTDQQSHGTHCIGSVLGRTNGIGMAPGARWIACRGLNHQGSGTEVDLLDCAAFMLDRANPKPHIITNSWGGGSNDVWYNDAMRSWIVAGMVPVFALGNSGSSCGSHNSPGDQGYCIGVGATNIDDEMAYFSSRGPTPYRMKPEVSAPGEDVISAGVTAPNSYTSKSGTSMATPHVAGLAALIMSQDMTMNFTTVMERMQETGDHPAVTNADLSCGEPGPGGWPNNAFGHGRINAARAVGATQLYF